MTHKRTPLIMVIILLPLLMVLAVISAGSLAAQAAASPGGAADPEGSDEAIQSGAVNGAQEARAAAGDLVISAVYTTFTQANVTAFWRNGEAGLSGDRLRVSPSAPNNPAGSAWWSHPIALGPDRSFSTYFAMQIHNPYPLDGGGDGLVFALQSQAKDALGDVGGGLGFGQVKPSAGIEFDTYQGDPTIDPNDNHIGVDLGGRVRSKVTATPTFDLQGPVSYVWVDYDGAADSLEVRVSIDGNRPVDEVLSYTVDLVAEIPAEVMMGFSAASGGQWQDHDILAFYFRNDYIPGGLDPVGQSYVPGPFQVTLTGPKTIANDGLPVEYTATAVNLNGDPLEGQTIQFTTDFGQLSGPSAVTDAAGQAVVQLSGTSLGKANLRALALGGAYDDAVVYIGDYLELCDLGPPLIDVDDLTYEGVDVVIDNCQATVNGAHSFNSLTLRNGASLGHLAGLSDGMWLDISGDAVIEAGSAISLTGRGFAGGVGEMSPGLGPGGGHITAELYGSGGGHGGRGGGPGGGLPYDSLNFPVLLGSGGSSGADLGSQAGDGGGRLYLVVAGTLTVDGEIRVDGTSGTVVGARDGGGGSGGSAWFAAGRFAGSGAILARGGESVQGGGGGGGRIAFVVDEYAFEGTFDASGGPGGLGNGLDGTIWPRPITGLTASNDSPTIEALATTLSATVSGGSDVSYAWDFGDGVQGSGQLLDHVYLSAGLYTATVTAANSLGSLQASTVVSITQWPGVAGVVWDDADGDGIWGPGEKGLYGAEVVVQPLDGSLVQGFTNLHGIYGLEIGAGGWFNAGATLAGYVGTTLDQHNLVLPDNGQVEANFGMVKASTGASGRIIGRAWADANGNDAPDDGETMLDNVSLSLHRDGGLVETVLTDDQGLYAFENLAAGVYTITWPIQEGYALDPATIEPITLAEYEIRSVLLPFETGGTVVGTVLDSTGNPKFQIPISLESPLGNVITSTKTGLDGSYQLGPVNPGAVDPNHAYVRLSPWDNSWVMVDGANVRRVTLVENGQWVEDWTLYQSQAVYVDVRTAAPPNPRVGGVSVVITNTTDGATSNVVTNHRFAVDSPAHPGHHWVRPLSDGLPEGTLFTPAWKDLQVTGVSAAIADFEVNLARSITIECQSISRACDVRVSVISDTLGTPPGTIVFERTHNVYGPVGQYFLNDLPSGIYNVMVGNFAPGFILPVHEQLVTLNDGTFATVRYPYDGNIGWIDVCAFADRNGDSAMQDDERVLIFQVEWEILDSEGQVVRDRSLVDCGLSFVNLPSGEYVIRFYPPPGFAATTPVEYQRMIDYLRPAEKIRFGVYLPYDLTGRVYIDQDGDGEFSKLVDDPVSGQPIELKTWSSSEHGYTVYYSSTVSGSDGSYAFPVLERNGYLVQVEAPGWMDAADPTLNKVEGLGWQNAAIQDFPLPPPAAGQAIVFLDKDPLDDIPEGDEQRVAGVLVKRYMRLAGTAGSWNVLLDEARTESDGVARFGPADLSNCTLADCLLRYVIEIEDSDLPPGVQPALPGEVYASASQPVVYLPLLPPLTVAVVPFLDTNGDGTRDRHEEVEMLAQVRADGGAWHYAGKYGQTLWLEEGFHTLELMAPPGKQTAVPQPMLGYVSASTAALVEVPIQYSGAVEGVVKTPLGAPLWYNLEVRLRNLDTEQTYVQPAIPPSNQFRFFLLPPGRYELTLVDVPAGYMLAGVPVFVVGESGAVQNLALTPLPSGGALDLGIPTAVAGKVYMDVDANGQYDDGEAGTDVYDLYLLNDAGKPAQTVFVGADGDFRVFLLPDINYALTLDLPGANAELPITAAPGWFSEVNHDPELMIGLYPYPWSPVAGFNQVAGMVYYQPKTLNRQPLAGALISYYVPDSRLGCDVPSPAVLGQTISDLNGAYLLNTLYDPKQYDNYCIRAEVPGFDQVLPVAVAAYDVINRGSFGNVTFSVVPYRELGVDLRMQPLTVQPDVSALSAEAYAVSWHAFRDDNLNGVWDVGEVALPGAILGNDVLSITSGLAGYGQLAGLNDGRTDLRITAPDGYAPVGPVSRSIWISGTAPSLPPIGFRLSGALSGRVFADDNGDVWLNGDEGGAGGITVTVSGPATTYTVSSPNGSFLFLDLPDGDYTLSAAVPSGYAPVPDQQITLAGGGVAHVPIQPLSLIGGLVYDDWDGDGLRGPDEKPPVIPITVTLANASGPITHTYLAAGRFAFLGLPSGTYTVATALAATVPTSAILDGNNGGSLALPAVTPNTVRGTAWLDANEDGRRQPWETPLAGIAVTLGLTQTTTTNSDGRFQFFAVPSGTHTLEVGLPPGLEADIPPINLATRGAAVGIAAHPPAPVSSSSFIYLPLLVKPGPAANLATLEQLFFPGGLYHGPNPVLFDARQNGGLFLLP